LSDPVWSKWSDREIARRCIVSNTFVSTLRASLTVNVDSDRRQYKTKHGASSEMNVVKIGARVSEVTKGFGVSEITKGGVVIAQAQPPDDKVVRFAVAPPPASASNSPIKSAEDLKLQLLSQMRNELDVCLTRYRGVMEIEEFVAPLAAMVAKLDAEIATLGARSQLNPQRAKDGGAQGLVRFSLTTRSLPWRYADRSGYNPLAHLHRCRLRVAAAPTEKQQQSR
jgi:hypothetical protein